MIARPSWREGGVGAAVAGRDPGVGLVLEPGVLVCGTIKAALLLAVHIGPLGACIRKCSDYFCLAIILSFTFSYCASVRISFDANWLFIL